MVYDACVSFLIWLRNAFTVDRSESQVSRIRIKLVLTLRSCYRLKRWLSRKGLAVGARLVLSFTVSLNLVCVFITKAKLVRQS